MKNLVSVFILLLMPFGVYAQMYLEDNFEDPGATMEKWEIIMGEWEVNNGIFQQTGQDIDPLRVHPGF